jgi:hypothetical protein
VLWHNNAAIAASVPMRQIPISEHASLHTSRHRHQLMTLHTSRHRHQLMTLPERMVLANTW